MNVQLMDQRRHGQLIKTAAEVIELMNIGVDGDDALFKYAKEHELNGHEIELVAHAINNSRQLAHLQTSQGEDREKAFKLVDPDQVQNKLQPPTNGAQNTGDRYGEPEEPSETAEHRAEQPDAVGISTRVSKEASYLEERSFFSEPEAPDYTQEIREQWGIEQEKLTKLADHVTSTPLADSTSYRAGIEEARVMASMARLECEHLLDKIAGDLRLTVAPAFDRFSKIASEHQVPSDLIDIIWDHTGLEAFGEITKRAHDTSQLTALELRLVDMCHQLDGQWKRAADADAASHILCEQFAKEESECIGVQRTTQHKHAGFFDLPDDKKDESSPIKSEPQKIDIDTAVPQWQRQELKGLETRTRLENLMNDDYISGFSAPEVIEAYNEAISLDPHFSESELRSYVRQHLASQGAVPLDLQLRARPKDHATLDDEGYRSRA